MHNVNRLVALKLIIANIKVEICAVDKLAVQRNMTRQRKPRIVMVGAVEVFPFHLSFGVFVFAPFFAFSTLFAKERE